MEWLKRINNAIDYIEHNLDSDISYDEAAQIACCSTYYFQRMFSYITGISLAEYIKRRRMTQAAFELQRTNKRVLEIALKYGYTSPTSFNRAFQNVHGISPVAAKDIGNTLNAYMAIINLRDYYPFYTSDCFMEVSEEVAEMFKEFDRKEAAYRLRTYRHKAYYSLDRDDGLEHEAVFVALSPHELYERKVTMQELHAAIASLPDKQAKRIYAHFILGMTKQDIARAESVHEKVVRVAIERGLRHLEKILKNSL